MTAKTVSSLYAQQVALMLFVAVPIVAVGAGVYDWLSADVPASLLDAVLSSLAMAYLVVGPWLLASSLLHTTLTRRRASTLTSLLIGMSLGAGAGLFAARLFGYQLAAGGWRLPVICTLIGALYGLIASMMSRRSVPASK